MITIQGKGVSAGVGVGPLYFYRRATAEIKRYTVEDMLAMRQRLITDFLSIFVKTKADAASRILSLLHIL